MSSSSLVHAHLSRVISSIVRPRCSLPQTARCFTFSSGDEGIAEARAIGSGSGQWKPNNGYPRKVKAVKSEWPIFDSDSTVAVEFENAAFVKADVKPSGAPQTGYASYNYKDGSKYAGFWKAGKYQGMGKKTYSNGNVYSGFWAEGKRHGKGKLFWKDNRYEGHWEHNKEHGRGKQVFGNGDCYEGWFYEGERCGQGKLIYANGDTLEGTFRYGEIYTGAGVARNKQGTTRVGEFVDGALQGPGKIVCRTGMVIEGEYLRGQVCGVCTVSYPTGDVYVGEWANGGRDGQGRLVYADGRVLQGEFRRNAIHSGVGVQRDKEGVELEGRWQDGHLVKSRV